MPEVKIRQRMRATVSTIDRWNLDTDAFEKMQTLPKSEWEEFIYDNGEEWDSSTEVDDLHETIDVEVTW